MLECDIAHRRSVVVLFMLYKIRCDLMHTRTTLHAHSFASECLTCATRASAGSVGDLVSNRSIYAPPRCRTLQYRIRFFPFSLSLWNDLVDPVFDGVGLAGFKNSISQCDWPPFCLLLFYLSLHSLYGWVWWGWGLRSDRVSITLSQPCDNRC